jgi:hypothetical protein
MARLQNGRNSSGIVSQDEQDTSKEACPHLPQFQQTEKFGLPSSSPRQTSVMRRDK